MAYQLTPKELRALKPSFHYISPELQAMKIFCESCKTHSTPPWNEKCLPLEVVPAATGGNWVPTGARIPCPECAAPIHLTLPVVKQTGGYTFYGDEGFRDIDGKIAITTYSSVGTLNRDIHILDRKILELKEKFAPQYDPATWTIHMTKIWSGQGRKKVPEFQDWDQKKVGNFCDCIFNLISQYGNTLYVVNSSGVFNLSGIKAKDIELKNHARNQVYLSLVSHIINTSTASGVRPQFVFDGEVVRNGTYTQPWAAEVFEGMKVNLLFPFLAHGIRIDSPKIIVPGSSPGAELADFICFVVARYLFNRISKKTIDLDPRRLGKVSYVGFNELGNTLGATQHGYPWSYFFNGK